MIKQQAPNSGGAMSVTEFARWAGIGRTSAWNEIRIGALRAIKANTRTLVTVDDARRWLSSRPTTTEASSRTRSAPRVAHRSQPNV